MDVPILEQTVSELEEKLVVVTKEKEMFALAEKQMRKKFASKHLVEYTTSEIQP